MPQNENVFERFRRQEESKAQCLKNHTAYFVGHHESTCEILDLRTDETIVCTLVLTDEEGPDNAYIYVPITADFQVGDYFTWNNTTFFAYESVMIVKDVDFYKFKVLQCNVFVNNSFWAFFRSGLRAARDNTMGKLAEVSTIVPLLIAPQREDLTYGGQVTFEDQVWNIEDGDTYTINGIGYYYITRGINPRTEEDVADAEEEMEIPSNRYYIGSTIDVPTEMGYYQADLKVKLVLRKNSTVTIQPLEAGELHVTVLKNGEASTLIYEIEENA